MAERFSYINYAYYALYSIIIFIQFHFLIGVFRACEYLADRVVEERTRRKNDKNEIPNNEIPKNEKKPAKKSGIIGWWM